MGKERNLPISRARHIFIVAGVESGHRGKDIAYYLGRDPSTVSRQLRESNKVIEDVKKILKKSEECFPL